MLGLTLLWMLAQTPSAPPAAAVEPSTYPLLFEPLMLTRTPAGSAQLAAIDLSSLERGASRGLDWASDALPGARSAPGVAWRLARFALVDFPGVSVLKSVDHEMFGHAWRCADFGLSPCGWFIAVPSPYGFGAGSHADTAPGPTLEAELYVRVAGHESDAVLTEEEIGVGLRDGRWDHLASLHLLMNALLPGLLSGTFSRDPSSDVRFYTQLWQERRMAEGRPLTLTDATTWVRGVVLADVLLDPLVWYSIYDYFWRWVGAGQRASAMPDFLPGPGLGVLRPALELTPWGPELGASAWWKSGLGWFEAQAWLGVTSRSPTATLTVDAPLPIPSAWRTEARLRVIGWRQEGELPVISPGPQRAAPSVVGGGGELELRFAGVERLQPVLHLGAKSQGYWPGRTLLAGAFAQAGVALRY